MNGTSSVVRIIAEMFNLPLPFVEKLARQKGV